MIRDVTPMLAVHDIDAACRFMRDCLGFKTIVQTDRHAYCERDNGAVRFLRANPKADLTDEARQVTVYIDAENADALCTEHRAALEALPPGHFRPPFDQDYGQREFHVIHGPILFFVGHPIPKDTAS